MPTALSPNEEAQLLQTIEMFEVITQSQPLDYQSLDILKEAYFKLGRQQDVVNTSKRIADAYKQLGQLSSAILEYESVLQLFPDDPDVKKALAEIENRATNFAETPVASDMETAEKPRNDAFKGVAPGAKLAVVNDIDDGFNSMRKLFVDGKLISEADFKKCWVTPALNEAPAKALDPFLQVIADKGYVPLDKSLKLVADKSRLSYLPIDKYDVDMELARSFPREVCRRWCVLPFDQMSKSVMIATSNPYNKQAMRDLEKSTKNRLLLYLASPPELIKTINKVYR